MALKNSTAVSPSGVSLNIDATTNNFSMIINGGTCYGYNLFITNTSNVTQLTTGVVDLTSSPIYDQETLSVDIDISSLSTGNTYKWYTQLYNKYSVITVTIASPGVVTWTGHGLSNGDQIILDTTGALPTGLSVDTYYYVVNASTNTFELSLTSGGASINTSGSQSGIHTAFTDTITDQSYIFYSDEVPTLGYLPAPSGSSPNKYYDVEGAIFEVRGTYSQSQSIPVKSWYWTLYNSTQTIIETYDTVYNQNILQEFDGLITARTYWIDFTVVTENDFTYTSEKVKFIVDYTNIESTINPEATNNTTTSGILVSYGGTIYREAVAVGAAPTYEADFLKTDNYGLIPGSNLEVIDIGNNTVFTCQIDWYNVNTSIDGYVGFILTNSSTGETITPYYDNSAGVLELYYNTTLIDSIAYTNPKLSASARIIFITCNGILGGATLKIVEGVIT